MMDNEAMLKAVIATAELMGGEMSPDSARMFCSDLQRYPEQQVMAALQKCRREVSGRLTLAAVVSRIDDGRLGAEEAWAMVPRDEWTSVVWTEEMAKASVAASSLLADGDAIAARMAFKEVYNAEVARARDAGEPVRWFMSPGWDKAGRESALREAVDLGRISVQEAQRCLPDFGSDGTDQSMKMLAMAAKSIKRVKK